MRRFMPLLVLLVLASAASAALNIPPPELPPWYQRPPTTTPPPRIAAMEYVDICMLVAALSAASWLAIRKRSRRWMFVLMLLCLGYFGFYRKGCVCPVGAGQNVALGLFNSLYAVPLVVLAFFLLPVLFSLFFGRTFCAAVCPLGAIQDVVLLRPIKVPDWIEQPLAMMRWLYLGAAVMLAANSCGFIVCRFDPFVNLFRMGGAASVLALGACVILIGLFIGRPYCRFACPYGAVLGLCSRVSMRRVTVTPAECIRCRRCENVCPFNAIRSATAEPPKRRTSERAVIAILAMLLPVLAIGGTILGGRLDGALSRMHPTISLTEQIVIEEKDAALEKRLPVGMTDSSIAFRASGQKIEDLLQEADTIRQRFYLGGMILGGFAGLVIGLKLLDMSVRKHRTDWEPDRSSCVACGRCFKYCPIELKRLERKERAAAR